MKEAKKESKVKCKEGKELCKRKRKRKNKEPDCDKPEMQTTCGGGRRKKLKSKIDSLIHFLL